ncbi:MAG: hypothetical protein ACXQTW_01915 [Candidatus Methanospirareceae archaeon]
MVKKGIGVWSGFREDPVLATRAMVDLAGAKLLRRFNPEYRRYERDLEELKKIRPDVHNLAKGTALLFATAFSVLCAAAYLMVAF